MEWFNEFSNKIFTLEAAAMADAFTSDQKKAIAQYLDGVVPIIFKIQSHLKEDNNLGDNVVLLCPKE